MASEKYYVYMPVELAYVLGCNCTISKALMAKARPQIHVFDNKNKCNYIFSSCIYVKSYDAVVGTS